MRILPPDLSFEQAVKRGFAGRLLLPGYLAWLRTLPCHTCGKPPPSEASHINSVKGMGTKAPDLFSIPECTTCNLNYDRCPPEVDNRLTLACWYILRAVFEQRLVWTNTPRDEVVVPRRFLEHLARAIDLRNGEGSPSIERADAEIIFADVRRLLA